MLCSVNTNGISISGTSRINTGLDPEPRESKALNPKHHKPYTPKTLEPYAP